MKCITTPEGYALLHQGAAALTRVTRNGVAIDREYLEGAKASLASQIRTIEEELESDPVGKLWRDTYGKAKKWNATAQLEHIVFDKLGFPRSGVKTEKGDWASGAKAFAHVTPQLPFLAKFFRRMKLVKALNTYLCQIEREVCGDILHPSYSLATTVTYRSSSFGINFQNLPVRDAEIMQIVRQCFRPRKGRRLIEIDLSGAEVRVGYCNHLDPEMRRYLLDPESDMHRDAASELFGLDRQWLKDNAAWAKKTVRDWAKNRYVFPQFYGSSYFQCAPHLWEAISAKDVSDNWLYRLPDGTPIIDHLAKQGIRSLGKCSPRMPAAPGTWEHRVKQAERALWNRLAGYARWKESIWNDYQQTARYRLLTGFELRGVFRKNQVTNGPIQGPAFHVLLKALILLDEWIQKHHADVLIVGQIHDSIIADVSDDWTADWIRAARHAITVSVPRIWRHWIKIPIDVEIEVCPIDGHWATKVAWTKQQLEAL